MSMLSDTIANFIQEMFEENDRIELKRNELAQYFQCAPSQINYVLTTRFTMEQGYITSSKRGGGGYVRIVRIHTEAVDIMELIHNIGQEISPSKAKLLISNLHSRDYITEREAHIMHAAISDLSMVPVQTRNYVCANIVKQMICSVLHCCEKEEEEQPHDMHELQEE